MIDHVENLREFLKRLTEGVDRALTDTAPGDDPMPVVIIEGPVEFVVIAVPSWGEMEGQDEAKNLLFGEVVPRMVLRHEGRFAGFASFAWQTPITEEEGKEAVEILTQRGLDRGDTAALRHILEEDMGIKLSAPERRIEVCTIVAASYEAEAMVMAQVIREEDEHPSIEVSLDTKPDRESPYGTFIGLAPSEDNDEPVIGGRVIEGLRLGLTLAKAKQDINERTA